MLTLSPGELWSEVEPEARERDGWVAFKPCPPCPTTPMAMRALRPEQVGGSLADRICAVKDARELLHRTLAVASEILRTQPSDYLYTGATQISSAAPTLSYELSQRYAADAVLTAKDAERVADLVLRVDFLARTEISDVGTLAVKDALDELHELTTLLLNSSACERPTSKFRWWLIPAVLIGTTLIVHSETKGRRK